MKTINYIEASLISSIVEVVLTHPLDYVKTLIQKDRKINLNGSSLMNIKKLYTGINSKLIGTIPMRFLFWNSLEYFNNNNYNKISAGILTSIFQTSIDFPIEVIKIQKINNNICWINSFKNIKIFPSLSIHLIRNTIFSIGVNVTIGDDKNSLYKAGLGAAIGSIISHPFDTLKTWYQSGEQYFPRKWTLKNYYRGVQYRTSISFISINIGWILYRRLKENIL
jgi:hypothetical protein